METCGFDAYTYPEAYGQSVLLSYEALVLVSRTPLASDHAYRVSVKTRRSVYSWAFRIEKPTPPLRRARAGG